MAEQLMPSPRIDVLPVGTSGSVTERCRLCTTNDEASLIDALAEQLWQSRQTGGVNDRPWSDAGEYWHLAFRELAETAVGMLRNE